MWINRWEKRSNLDIFFIVSFARIPTRPNTRSKLAMFDPTTLPIDKSGDSFKTASIETSNSDSDVPNPITTTPMKNSDISILFPIDTALDIKMSAPFTTKRRPKIKKIKEKLTDIN